VLEYQLVVIDETTVVVCDDEIELDSVPVEKSSVVSSSVEV
jgi:hypothetical protein